MWKSIVLQAVAFVLACTSAYISYTLLQVHVNAKPPEWVDFGCSVKSDKGAANCKAVIQTRWGYLPPLKEDRTAYTRWTFPAAQVGWMYYSAIAIWILGIGRPSVQRKWVHAILLGFVGLGVVGSIYFIVIMFSRLDQWCPWCIVTHVANFGIAACAVFLWPRRGKSPDAGPGAAKTPLPTIRGLIATAVAMILAATTEHYMLAKALQESLATNTRETLARCMHGLNEFRQNPGLMMALWDQSPTVAIPIRPDDPMKTAAKPGRPIWDLIVFSDFECPSCKRTAAFIDQQAITMFDGGLRIVYKHFPADPACNAQVSSVLHKNACLATQVAEAARMQGGIPTFWAAHDLLFSIQKDTTGLDGLDPAKIAAQLQLDPKKLLADMTSPIIAQRIAEDAAAAVSAGIQSTPHLVLQGKSINSNAAKEITFWDKLAERYWQQAGVERPEWTKLKPVTPATPGTPAPAGGK